MDSVRKSDVFTDHGIEPLYFYSVELRSMLSSIPDIEENCKYSPPRAILILNSYMFVDYVGTFHFIILHRYEYSVLYNIYVCTYTRYL